MAAQSATEKPEYAIERRAARRRHPDPRGDPPRYARVAGAPALLYAWGVVMSCSLCGADGDA